MVKNALKVLLIFFLCLLFFMLNSCMSKEEFDRINTFKDDFVDLIEDFGNPQDWTDDFGSYVNNTELGGIADFYTFDREYVILHFYYEDGIFLTVEISLNYEEDRNEQLIDYVFITYVNYNERTMISLDYYHYDELFTEDFSTETLDYSFNDLTGLIKLLEIYDWEDIIARIGYSDIVNPL